MKRYSLFLISLILLMTTGCNQRKEVAENPFFEEWETPYGVPPFDRIRPEHFLPAFQRAMSIQKPRSTLSNPTAISPLSRMSSWLTTVRV